MPTATLTTSSGEEITVTYEGEKTPEEIKEIAREQLRYRTLEALLGKNAVEAEQPAPTALPLEREPATARDEVAGAFARPFIGTLGLGQDIINYSYQNMGLLGDALGIEDDDKLVSDELVNRLKRKVADGIAAVASSDQRFFRPGLSAVESSLAEEIRATKNNERFLDNKDIPPIKSESFLTEEGAIRTPETLAGVTATVGTYIATGGVARSAASAWAASLSRGTPLFKSILSGASTLAITENLLYTGNPEGEQISAAFDSLDEQGHIQLWENVKDLVEFFSIDEGDDELEQRLKLTIEGFAVSGILTGLLEGLGISASAIRNLANKDPKTQTKLTMQYLTEAKENLALSSSNTHRPVVTALLYGKGVGEETVEGLAQIESQRAGFSKFVSKWLTSRGYFTPVGFNAWRQKEYATRQIIKEAENISGRLETALNNVATKTILTFDPQKIKASQQQYRDKVKEALTGKVTFKKGDTIEEQARQLGLPVEVAEPVIEARALIDKLSSRLVNSSIPDEALRQVIFDNTGKYLNRSYRLFEDSGFKPSESSTQYVVNQLQKIKIKGGMDADEAYEVSKKEVDDLIRSLKENKGGFIQAWGSLTKETKNILLSRKKLTPELREFLGEIENPSENVVLTVSRMARLLENNKFNSKIYNMAKGKYVFDKRTSGYEYQINIPGSVLHEKFTTREFGLAVEGRQDDFAMFLEGLGGKIAPAAASVLRLWGYAKGQTQKAVTVYRPATQIRNIYGAGEVALATGVPPWYITKGMKTLFNNAKTGGDPEIDKVYEELLGLGVVNTSTRVNEFRRLIRVFSKVDEDKISRNTILSTLEKVGKPFEGAYVAGDDYFKINAYFYELDTLQKAYPNQPLELLKQQAALKIRNGIQNYDMISPGTKDLRYSFLGNFPAFASEIVRTAFHNVKMASEELTSGNAVMARRGAQRLAFYVTVPTAWEIGSEASARLVGFNEEEEEAANVLTRTPWSQASRIYSVKDGEIHYTDIRFIDAKNTLKEPVQRFYNEIVSGELKGRELDQVLLDASKEAMMVFAAPYAEKSILTESITDIVGAINTGGRIPSGERLFTTDDSIPEIMGQLTLHLLSSFNPGIVDSGFKVTRAALIDEELNEREPFGYEKYNFDLELRRSLGLSQTPFRPDQALYYHALDYLRNRRGRERQTPSYGVPIEKTLENLETNMNLEYKAQQDFFEVVNAARVFLGTDQTASVLKEAGISKDLTQALFSNRGYFYEYFDKNKYDIFQRHPKLVENQEKYEELRNTLLGMENAFNHTRLIKLPEDAKYFQSPDPRIGGPVPNLQFDELREDMAKGGEVYNVPQVPVEPDERIDKMTGRPYNEQAGEAFIDEEDRMGFVAGGGAIAKKIAKFLAEDVAEEAAPKAKPVAEDVVEGAVPKAKPVLQRSKGEPLSDDTLRPYEDLPKLTTTDEMENALDKRQKQKINVEIADGQRVGIRLDINAYLRKDTWIPTIHVEPKGTSSHRATVAISNVDLMPTASSQRKSKKVMEGGPKTPFARIGGNLINRTDEENYRLARKALNDPEWTQVGFNPDRHSYFFDRFTGDPVIAGDEAIQIGPLVLVKNAVRGERSDFLYNQGGLYGSISGLMEKAAREFFGVSTKDLRANEREAAELVNSLVAAGKLPEREKVTYEDGRVLSGDVFNAANHMFLANIAKDSEVKRLALQGKEYIQQATGDTGPHGAIGDRKNNSLGFEFYDMAKGNPKVFKQLVSENLIDRFGQAEGGLTRRLAKAVGGSIGLPIVIPTEYKEFLERQKRGVGSIVARLMAKPVLTPALKKEAVEAVGAEAKAGKKLDSYVSVPEEIKEEYFDRVIDVIHKTENILINDFDVTQNQLKVLAYNAEDVEDYSQFLKELIVGLEKGDVSAESLPYYFDQMEKVQFIKLHEDKFTQDFIDYFTGKQAIDYKKLNQFYEDYKSLFTEGGTPKRTAKAKGGKIDKKKMACNKPRRTPNHPKKSHVVKACEGGKEKIIRFGEQGAKTAGKPKAGESKRMKAKRKSFKARHGRNIRKGKMSAAYWANKVKW